MTNTMSNTFSALMTMYVVTTTIVGRMLGMMTRRNTWNSEAPSMRAASMISSGIGLDGRRQDHHGEPGLHPDHDHHQEQVVPRLLLEPGDGLLAEPEHDAVEQSDVRAEPLRDGSCRSTGT